MVTTFDLTMTNITQQKLTAFVDVRIGSGLGTRTHFSTTLGHKSSKAAPEIWLMVGWNCTYSGSKYL